MNTKPNVFLLRMYGKMHAYRDIAVRTNTCPVFAILSSMSISGVPFACMSLNSVLQSARRAKVPENVLAQCRDADRTVVENILVVLQEEIPTLDITRSALTHSAGVYQVAVPSVKPQDKVRLRQLLNIQAFNPGRIQDIEVGFHNDALVLLVAVYDEAAPITTSQLDIMRICKKTKRI